MYKFLSLLVLAGSLTFGWYSDFHLSVPDKVNKAFPPSAEVRISLENLESLLSSDKVAAKSFHDNYESRLILRALTCSQQVSISRFVSVEKIKSFEIDRDCLKQQDTELLNLIGTKFVGLRILQSPLRPLVKLGPPSVIHGIEGVEINTGSVASNAGVAVLKGGRNEFVAVEVPGGKKIAKLPSVPEAYQNETLSPNGRVTAIPIGNREILFVDNETGQELWRTTEFTEVLVWLPELSAALVKRSKTSTLAIVDFSTGKIQPYSIALNNPTWGLRVRDTPSQVLIGSGREFTLIENSRSSGNVEGTVVKDFRIKTPRGGVTSLKPTLMLDGEAIVFISGRDIMMFNLNTYEEKLWEINGIIANRYGKLSEETLLVESYGQASGTVKTLSFNIKNSTVSPVENEEARSGIILVLDGRNGFMRREYNKMWIGDELKIGGPPVSLTELITQRNLEKQLAVLEAESRMIQSRLDADKINTYLSRMQKSGAYPYDPRRRSYPTHGNPVAMPAPEPEPIAPAVGAPEYEAILAAKRQEFAALAVQQVGNIPSNAKVEAIGVYETKDRSPSGVNVLIKKSDKPIVLMLSSYEPVRWNLIKESGANLAAVIATGYNLSTITGAGTTKTLIKKGNYAYRQDSPEYQLVNRDALLWTGKTISKFQGAYGGTYFVVGNK